MDLKQFLTNNTLRSGAITSNPLPLKTEQMKKDWLIFKVEGKSYTLTDDNEKTIRGILLECYQPYTMVQVLDYQTGKLIEELNIDALYGEKES